MVLSEASKIGAIAGGLTSLVMSIITEVIKLLI